MSFYKIFFTISFLFLSLNGFTQDWRTRDIHDSLGDPWDRMGKYYGDHNFVDSTEIFPQQIMYELYSMNKLWNEDSCGHKGYKQAVVTYIRSLIHYNRANLSQADVIKILGPPDDIQSFKKGDTYRYPLVKESDCKEVSQFAWFDFRDSTLLQIDIEIPMFRDDY